MSKNAERRFCEKCNFECIKKSEWERHILTAKHNRTKIQNTIEPKIKKTPKVRRTEYNCSKCNKSYSARNSLWYHEKKCSYNPPPMVENVHADSYHSNNTPELYAIIQMLIKENQHTRNAMITQNNVLVEQNKALSELVKKQQPTVSNSNNITNSHNNYNINMFLTDKCKDAKNMSEFIEVLKNKVDMFQIEETGYVDGISKLFIEELNSMEVTERPLHCTDERRNTFYIHNNDTWNKDDNLKDTKKAINHVSHANLQQCLAWSAKVPPGGADREEHITRSIRLCKEANKSSDDTKVDKIIKNISKEIPLNKQVINDSLV